MTRQLDDLGQNRWLDNITRHLLNSETCGQYVDKPAGTVPATAIQIGCQEVNL